MIGFNGGLIGKERTTSTAQSQPGAWSQQEQVLYRRAEKWPGLLWTPKIITTMLWLDASDSTTITTESGNVSQWNDKSGNDRHLSQSTSTNRPALTSAGQNGLNVITFDGSNDGLQGSFAAMSLTAQSSFAVAKVSASSSFARIFSQATSTQADYASTGAYLPILAGNASNTIASFTNTEVGIASFSTGSFGILQSVHSGTAITNAVNGTAVASVNHTLSLVASRFSVGKTTGENQGYLNGVIAEVVVLPSAATLTTQQLIQGYLAHKWGLAVSLPAGHPYKTAPP